MKNNIKCLSILLILSTKWVCLLRVVQGFRQGCSPRLVAEHLPRHELHLTYDDLPRYGHCVINLSHPQDSTYKVVAHLAASKQILQGL